MVRRRSTSSPRGKTGKRRAASSKAHQAEAESASARHGGRRLWIAAGLAAVAVVAAGLGLDYLARRPAEPAALEPEKLAFVGSDTCISCHREQGTLWHRSQHAHAMAHATEETVFGDFDGVTFDYYGTTSRFFKKDGKFFVETDGPDGTLETYEVKYTFGLEPLQQYLIEFPDGRVQALTIAWDSRTKQEGGQRWFHLYPDEPIGHDDPLHWTKLNQNWNFMCAECHSTGVAKNYDRRRDRFHTTWKEISVGCEACHGQGSAHVAWAESWPLPGAEDNARGLLALFDERSGITWTRQTETGQPVRSETPPRVRKEVEMCGRCHARRGIIAEAFVPGRPLSDSHHVSLIARGLYQADGQMLDEVYNYGSFKQSKMFAAGVTCSDCHDPHSARLRAKGDRVCLQCHAGGYAEAGHTHHEGADAPSCVGCHMPARTFMVIDVRHDHSFRIPRPDLSETLGTANACTDCHRDKQAGWAAAAIEKWYGRESKGFQTFGPAFHAAWTGAPDAAALLAAVATDQATPAFVRASALEELVSFPSRETAAVVRAGLLDPDPMVRTAALDHLETAPPAQLWPLISPLLGDPVRGVRIKTAFLLAGAPAANLSPADRSRLAAAEKEFVAAQELNADRPESRSLLARYHARKGDAVLAEAEYRAALRLSPHFTPAAINLADLYRAQGRDQDGVSVLREAIALSPDDGGLYHALGLALVRLKQSGEAVKALKRAAELEPGRARYAYVYAVGLESIGQRAEAIAILRDSLQRHSHDRDTLLALVNFSRVDSDVSAALGYAERLATIEPDNQDLKRLIAALKQQRGE